jgi:hypothetical protein
MSCPELPPALEPAAQAFASPFLTANRYLFAILPVVAVIGNWRRNMRLFPPLNTALPQRVALLSLRNRAAGRVAKPAWSLVAMAMNLLNPFPPRRLSVDVTTDKVAVYVHCIEYALVMGLDAYMLTSGMRAGFHEIAHGLAWRESRGVNALVFIVSLVFYIRCVRTVLCALTQRMLYYDALLDRLFLLSVKLSLLIAVHSVVGAHRPELVDAGVLHFVVSPTDVLVITLSGQLRMVLAEWMGLDLDSERRSIQSHARAISPAPAKDDGSGTALLSKPSDPAAGGPAASAPGSAQDIKLQAMRKPL